MKLLSKFAAVVLLLALMISVIPAAAVQPAHAATCYWAQFVSDVTIPDGTSFAPGSAFNKTWRIKNIGSCAWNTPDVSLVFDSGERMGAPASVTLPTTVNPGQTVDITVTLTAPSAAGHYYGYYKFKSASGGVFGIGYTAAKAFWVEIYVTGSSGTGYDFTANAASASWSSGAGALNFPGADGNANGYSLKRDRPKPETGIESAQAGLVFVPNNVTNGYIQASYPAFRVLSGDRFQATIGCEYGVTNCYIAYRLDYQIGSNAVRTFWTFREKYEGSVYNVNLDLSSLANQDVRFILVVSAYGSPLDDRALWINPVISRPGGTVITPVPITPGPITPPPSSCDRAQFIADVTVPDGTTFQPTAAFTKTWRLKNVGACTWNNYNLVFDSGEKMSGPDAALIPASVAPGQTVDITVNLKAPANGGSYRGYWKLKNNTGVPFGIGSGGTKSFWVDIRVSGTPVTPITPVVTPITPIPITPIVGTSYDFVANVCAAKWYSGAGELPCPGASGDTRGYVLVTAPSRLENGANDSRPGLITFPQNVSNGYIQGIYPTYRVKSGDKFRAVVNCENGAPQCYVVFRLDYSSAGTSSIQTYWAFVERYEGQYYTADIDLTALAGQDIKFILTVLATGASTDDRALWVAPIIYNPSSQPPATYTPTPTPIVTPTFTPTTPIPSVYNYDFGTPVSPVAAGFTRITESSIYALGSAGWTDISGLESRDRSMVTDDLKRDFVMSSSVARIFKVDVPNGNYVVNITMGDSDYAHDNMMVKANGTTVLPDVDNAQGAFTTNTFTVNVGSGSLSLEFSDGGGVDPSWVINTITLIRQ